VTNSDISPKPLALGYITRYNLLQSVDGPRRCGVTATCFIQKCVGVKMGQNWKTCHVTLSPNELGRALHSSLCDCPKTSSTFCCQSSPGSVVLPTEFLLCRRPDDVQLTTETLAWSVRTTSVFAGADLGFYKDGCPIHLNSGVARL